MPAVSFLLLGLRGGCGVEDVDQSFAKAIYTHKHHNESYSHLNRESKSHLQLLTRAVGALQGPATLFVLKNSVRRFARVGTEWSRCRSLSPSIRF